MDCIELRKYLQIQYIFAVWTQAQVIHLLKNTLSLFYYHLCYITIVWQCFYVHLSIMSEVISLSFAYIHTYNVFDLSHPIVTFSCPSPLLPILFLFPKNHRTSMSFVCDSISFTTVAYRGVGKWSLTET